MARSRDAFNQTPAVGTPTGWKEVGAASGVEYEIIEDLTAESDRVLQITKSATTRPLLTLDAADGSSSPDTLIRFKIEDSAINFSLWLCANNVVGDFEGYMIETHSGGLGLWIANGGTSFTSLDTDSFVRSLDTWYIMRIRRNGTSVQARIWAATDNEPTSWNLSATNGTYSSGDIGFSVAGGPGVAYVDFQSAANGGDAACILADGDMPDMALLQTNSNDNSVRYQPTDGGIETLVAIIDGGNIRGIEPDPEFGTFYVCSRDLDSLFMFDRYGLNRTTIDGSINDCYGVTLDPVAGEIFYTSTANGQIYRANRDGSSRTLIVSLGSAGMWHPFWNAADSLIYCPTRTGASARIRSYDRTGSLDTTYATKTDVVACLVDSTHVYAFSFNTSQFISRVAIGDTGSFTNVDTSTDRGYQDASFGSGLTHFYSYVAAPHNDILYWNPTLETAEREIIKTDSGGGRGIAFVNWAAALVVTSVSPTEGAPGQEVTITGEGFASVTAIDFNGTDAPTFTINDATSITVTIPEGATSGPITVESASESDTYPNFIVLPAIPVDGYNIEMFQIEVNVGETDIEQVAGTYRRYITEGTVGDTIDFIPTSISNLEQSVEWEEGIYKFGSVDMTVALLEADYFNDYTDYINSPIVVIVRSGVGAVLFHGIVDPEECNYNAGTKFTSFRVLSWESILESTNAPCRSVYETTFSRDYSDALVSGQNSTFYIKKVINGLDMTTVVEAGSVLVFDTPAGEVRSLVVQVVEDGDDLALQGTGAPTVFLAQNFDVLAAECNVSQVGSGGLVFQRLRMTFDDAQIWQNLESAPDARDGNELLLTIEVGSQTYTVPLVNSLVDTRGAWYFLDEDRITVRMYMNINAADKTEFLTNGCTISVTSQTDVRAGESVRILGYDLYGYQATGIFGALKRWSLADGLLEAMFSLPELGVLPYVVNEFDFPAGFDRDLDQWVELPPQLNEALKQIQNTHYLLLRSEPSVENGLPRLKIVVRPRNAANTSETPVITGVTNIVDWTESAADQAPTAIIVKPDIEYFRPKGNITNLGFYYDGVDAADPATTGRPQGGRVVEITVNVTPAYDGELFFGEGQPVRNDVKLRAIAEQFYLFYKGLKRPCTFTVNGVPSVDWLAKFLTISEIEDPLTGTLFERTVFVTQVTINQNTNQTTVVGRIGEYIDAADQNPVAIVDGQRVWNDGDDSGDEVVRLSAVRSYDPQGGLLTYEWAEGMTVLSTSPVLETTLAVGDHTITLTVTDSDTNATSIDVDVKVQGIASDPPEGDIEQANFVAQSFTVNSDGDVLVSVTGDFRTQTTDGVKIRTATTQGGLDAAVDTEYDNPVIAEEIASALDTGEILWVRVTLVNDEDGTDSSNVWEFPVVNTTATTALVIPSNTAPTGTADVAGVQGELRYDDSYLYVKTSAGWKRTALSTF